MLSFNFLGKESKKELFNNISKFFVSSSAQSNRFIYFFNDNIRNASNYIKQNSFLNITDNNTLRKKLTIHFLPKLLIAHKYYNAKKILFFNMKYIWNFNDNFFSWICMKCEYGCNLLAYAQKMHLKKNMLKMYMKCN